MGLVAAYDIPCEALPLVSVAATAREASLTLALQYNHGRRPLFQVTASGGSPGVIEQALDDAVDVGPYTLVGEAGDTRRYQIEPALSLAEQLGDHVDDLSALEALATADASIQEIAVLPSGWRQRGWFADREAFDAIRTFWERNCGFELQRLTRDGEPAAPGDGLTDGQREALRTAYELGYFEVPRGASLSDVAEHLGISASATSERLRRAQTQLIERTVATTWPPLPE